MCAFNVQCKSFLLEFKTIRNLLTCRLFILCSFYSISLHFVPFQFHSFKFVHHKYGAKYWVQLLLMLRSLWVCSLLLRLSLLMWIVRMVCSITMNWKLFRTSFTMYNGIQKATLQMNHDNTHIFVAVYSFAFGFTFRIFFSSLQLTEQKNKHIHFFFLPMHFFPVEIESLMYFPLFKTQWNEKVFASNKSKHTTFNRVMLFFSVCICCYRFVYHVFFFTLSLYWLIVFAIDKSFNWMAYVYVVCVRVC